MFALVVIILLIIVLLGVYQKSTNGVCKSNKTLHGKVAVVTGGTLGMGLVIATNLARRGAKVIVACPFEEEGSHARKHIVQVTGNEKVIFKYLDLSSLNSVHGFAKNILQTEERLDILVNNAGVGIPNDFTTNDGMSFIMQVNYYGHFLLTLLLLPLLKKTGNQLEPSRIINTSSVLHLFGRLREIPQNTENLFLKTLIYSDSKFCLALFTHELAKKLLDCHVVVNTVDPGYVGTQIFDSVGKIYGPIIIFLSNMLLKNTWEGAQTALHVALDKDTGSVSGQYFRNCKLSRAKSAVYNDEQSQFLWAKSLQLVKLNSHEE